MFGFITEPIFWILGYVYMPYMSFKAIQTPDGKDDKEWLTTWVIYSMLSMLQTLPIIGNLVGWIPFYYEVKLIIIVYCYYHADYDCYHYGPQRRGIGGGRPHKGQRRGARGAGGPRRGGGPRPRL